jgi:ABC-2 type transport system permease protein
MKQIERMWLIALKDLKIFLKDRGTVFFFLIFPLLFIFLFNFVMKGIGGEDQRLELHLATLEAAGGLSYQIIGAMETKDESLLKPGDPKIVWDKDYTEARQAVLDKKLAGFIAFPADFTAALMSGKSTSLEVFADAGNVNTRAALNGMAGAISSRIGTDHVIIEASVALLTEAGVIAPADTAGINQAVQRMMNELFTANAGGAEPAFLTFKTEKIGEVQAENPANFVIPGYLVMFVFFAAAIMAESIVRERKNHTLERLLASSVKRESILGGIYIGSAIRGLFQIVVFWAVGMLVFHVDMGLSPAAVIILSVLMVIMSSAFTLMLATIARTERSAGSLAVITSLVLAPLGGCWWPFFLYPPWLQTIAKVTPHAWATTGFNKIMVFGAGFSAAVPSMVALLVFTVIFGVIAAWRFRTSAV